jgi:large subunit ribosomal protein L27
MAHKKGQGTSRNGRDSHSKRLGIKKYDGEYVLSGNILIRQRGTRFHAGKHVGMGVDHTLYALKEGRVKWDAKHRSVQIFEAVTEVAAAPVEELVEAVAAE